MYYIMSPDIECTCSLPCDEHIFESVKSFWSSDVLWYSKFISNVTILYIIFSTKVSCQNFQYLSVENKILFYGKTNM